MRRLRAVFKRFKRPKPAVAGANAVLSEAVIAAIDVAHIMPRAPGENGAHRTAVQFDGWSGWLFSDEGAGKALAKMFPELCERQLQQGVQRLRARVKLRIREHAEQMDQLFNPQDARKSRPWKDRY